MNGPCLSVNKVERVHLMIAGVLFGKLSPAVLVRVFSVQIQVHL